MYFTQLCSKREEALADKVCVESIKHINISESRKKVKGRLLNVITLSCSFIYIYMPAVSLSAGLAFLSSTVSSKFKFD